MGRPELSERGRWIAAVLACGPGAMLSHATAAALWGMRIGTEQLIHVSVAAETRHRHRGLRVHRRAPTVDLEPRLREGIPVSGPVATLVDIAASAPGQLELAVNEADRLGLIDPEALSAAVARLPPRQGVGRLGRLLERQSFALTDSELERHFLRIVQAAGLPRPKTQQWVNGFRVDFYWPDLRLVVETDGLSYHRTPSQQERDRRRDQAHTSVGLANLRFTHSQVRYEAAYVRSVLESTIRDGA